jgi:hemolysin activation/secretion protein
VHDLAEEEEEHRWGKRFAREAGWLAVVGRARCSILVVALLGSIALPAQLYAQAPGAVQTPIELRFDIARYRVEGNTILAADEVERIVSGYTGKARDFGDVQRALEALQEAYRERGYSAVQVYLPEQELARGEVLLKVVEGRISKLEIAGNKFFDNANIERSLPALAEGSVPNGNLVAKNLRLANENPGKQTNVTLRAGAKEGEVEARVDVVDENPSKWFLTLDNTGTPQTGYDRFGIGYQHSNIANLDHAMTAMFITSVEKPSEVGIYSVGYHMPLYGYGSSVDLVAGYSDVNAGTTSTPSGPLAFSGRGWITGARYNWHLDHHAGYDHKLIFGLDYRYYDNACSIGAFGSAGCGAAAATYSILPLSATYAGTWTLPSARAGFYGTVAANLGGFSRGDSSDLQLARANADVHYWVTRGGFDGATALAGDWQLRGRVDAQYTDEVLVPAEQFGIGGQNSVRGFLEREVASDKGHSASLEVYTPELAPMIGLKEWNARLLAFYDLGRIYRVNPLPGEQTREGIAAAGLGLRLALQKKFTLRFDVANILQQGGTRQEGHWRFTFGSILSF